MFHIGGFTRIFQNQNHGSSEAGLHMHTDNYTENCLNKLEAIQRWSAICRV